MRPTGTNGERPLVWKETAMTVSKQQYKAALVVLAKFEADTKAKRTKVAKPTKARKVHRKTENRVAPANATVEGHRCLTRRNREMFVVDHEWAGAHDSVRDLVSEVVLGKAPLVGTWAIGVGHVAKALGVEEEGVQPITRETQGGKAPKAKKAKKGKKAKHEVVVVDEGPEWGTPAWIAATHPREKDTPRNAAGRPTPRKEWPIRIELERSGKFDRNEVDTKVKAAYDAGLIEA